MRRFTRPVQSGSESESDSSCVACFDALVLCVPNWIVSTWYGLWAIKGTPQPIVQALNGHIQAISRDENAQRRALAMGGWLLGTTPEGAVARLRKEAPMWAEMVRVAGAKVE